MGTDTSVDQRASQRKYRFRVRPTWAPNTRGSKYLQAALAARDGTGQTSSTETSDNEQASATSRTSERSSLFNDSTRTNGLNNANTVQQDRVFVGQS